MNGWQRICLVIFALWVVGIFIFGWLDFNKDARNSATSAEVSCIQAKHPISSSKTGRFILRRTEPTSNIPNAGNDNLTADSKKQISTNAPVTQTAIQEINCSDVYKNKIEERWKDNFKDLKENWWLITIIVFAPPFFIMVIWVFSYILVKIFYWIKAGFSKADKPREMAKKSSILTASIIFIFVAFIGISTMRESNKKAEFEIALGECKLAEMKAKLPNENEAYINYIKVCMQTKGYNFVYSNSCNEYLLSEYRCYGN